MLNKLIANNVVDIRVWKANKLRPFINQIDKEREILRKNTPHLRLIKGAKDEYKNNSRT